MNPEVISNLSNINNLAVFWSRFWNVFAFSHFLTMKHLNTPHFNQFLLTLCYYLKFYYTFFVMIFLPRPHFTLLVSTHAGRGLVRWRPVLAGGEMCEVGGSRRGRGTSCSWGQCFKWPLVSEARYLRCSPQASPRRTVVAESPTQAFI